MFDGTEIDYTPGPYSLTIPAGLTNASYDVVISNDILLEDNETFYLVISPSSLPSGVTVGDINQATVIIINDDSKKY